MPAGETRSRSIAIAASVVATVVCVEYLARHLVAFVFPTIAAPRVNDMIATGVAYVALSLGIARVLGASDLRGALLGLLRSPGRWEAWVGAPAALASALLLGVSDHFAWGSVKLPAFWAAPRSTTFLAGAPWLPAASLLLVNGLVVPVAEEWLWRGVVQPRFVRALGGLVGIGLTAVLFSLKHAVVDASLGRLLGITGVGVVLGLVARRASWKASAFSHVVMNTGATAFALIANAFAPPPCLSPEPQPSADLLDARTRALHLVETRDRAEIEVLFAPNYLAHFPPEKVLDFYGHVHDAYGACTWKCTMEVVSENAVRGQLACERGSPFVVIGIERDAPHRVNWFGIALFAQLLR